MISYLFDFNLLSAGWSLMYTFNSFTWGWTVLFWLLRFIVDDNDNINWLYVLFSNLTMFGPLGFYWLSLLLIIAGWIIKVFDGFSAKQAFYLFEWFFTAVFASVLQWSWIDAVRAEYTGDNKTAGDKVDDWHEKNYELFPDDDENGDGDTITDIELTM